jgi:ribosome recycling factor
VDEYLDSMNDDMNKALEALTQALATVRTGRATPKLLEGVQILVHAYGATMPINQLASIQAPDARLLVVTPWDKSTMQDIERGILAAGLGLNPSSDGQVIRVPVPPLTAERRQDLVKQVRKHGEEIKVRMRHVRRDYNDMFKEAEGSGEIGEDALRKYLQKVQDTTDMFVEKADKLMAAKESEVLEV